MIKIFADRHIGTSKEEQDFMLKTLGQDSLDKFINQILPENVKLKQELNLPESSSENEALFELKNIANQNKVFKNFIGQGYYGTILPTVILRNVLENPAWYTSYTPYQSEISQGRLEALLNFQTLISDLTALPIANASMLDEATAVAEAMTMAKRSSVNKSQNFLVHFDIFPQTLAVLKTRAKYLNIEIILAENDQDWQQLIKKENYFASLIQYTGNSGEIYDLTNLAGIIHEKKSLLIVATDLLALTLIKPPGEFGADIVIGSSQRFGLPIGAGGPHSAFIACTENLKRNLPGRIVGVSIDSQGNPALRLALQTREQHIRREKATSNICTAQALLAIISSMFAIYHGPENLKKIAEKIQNLTSVLRESLIKSNFKIVNQNSFDTLEIETEKAQNIFEKAQQNNLNLRLISDKKLGISLDETTTEKDILDLIKIFSQNEISLNFNQGNKKLIPENLLRKSKFLTHKVFNSYHSETAMLRYIRSLSDKDLALDRCMIPLGSCTMKLNSTTSMIPISWTKFANIHPFAPIEQLKGYKKINKDLTTWLAEITGYDAVSLQPNSGANGEYAGLLAIRSYHESNGESHRNICLIPASAHGTNPASASLCGLEIVVVTCDEKGNIDMSDLKLKCQKYAENLACIMITYPSTHGVFESSVKELVDLIHSYGGFVYVDGANMNALVGLSAPGKFGGDVSHLNLHKTFSIPHGGGGPGVGPVCVVEKLKAFLPNFEENKIQVSATQLGNAGVLPIVWTYIKMLGAEGLKNSTASAILVANYISFKLKNYYPTLYADNSGFIAHECILDLRPLKATSGVTAEDVAKRLIDYGFHAPTLSFPVAGTLMVEPTESEPLSEIERFIEAMISIRQEIKNIEDEVWSKEDNPLKHAPHTFDCLTQDNWTYSYSRKVAKADNKIQYFAPVGRVDNVLGDRNLICSCPSIEDYS